MHTSRTATYEHLLAPGTIGPMRLANRVVMPAMDMNLCHDGVIDDGDIAHYASRAAGGTGLIITSAAAVAYPVGATSRKEPGLSDDRFIPGLTALADAVHAAGAKLCVQATHHGKIAKVDTADGRPLFVPSIPVGERDLTALRDNTPTELGAMATAVSEGRTPTYREATEEDIAWLVGQFAAAARRVRQAGADAIEIHCAHGYVLGSFLSRADNRRTDAWGGSLENRARLACDVIRAVREEVGDGLAILVRVAGKEYGDDGALTTEEAVAASRLFEAAGADAIHVTGWARNPFRDFTDGPLPNQVGAYAELARAVKDAVSIPVIAVGRVLPALGEELIASGGADFVAMGRQLLADPELVGKIRDGRAASVRPCINCYVCVEQNFWDGVPVCAVNPALGDETLLPFPTIASRRHVVVVGGGPGGLEAARVAAERGHRVTLVEKGDRLGGSAWFSQLTTPANGPLLEWLQHEVERLGVDVRLGEQVDADAVAALSPDAVVVATGARRGLPPVPGADLPHVHTGDTLRGLITGEGGSGSRTLRLLGAAGRMSGLTRDPERIRDLTRKVLPIGKDVVVVGGSLVGLELAEFLAERRKSVTVLEQGAQAGLPMAVPRRWTAVRQATEHGVTIHRDAELVEITASEVHYLVGDELARVPADLVVVASYVEPGAPLADSLRARGLDVHVVGDAAEVGYLQGAIHSAWRACRTL
ncbi:oxidoreductase [Nocardioides nitrophenolicus]|uniref:oxidoreductase n=1 Tax=Nocardioides nitrophenolicus TaxID=60489 RepID=UPI00195E9DC6|nr:FAD-dependent oxidoreductase [Nocardioides nitrophenolicus]MBM7519631.1 2,4-dienoyl-CoA reductase-like NADH-dependent reductase (Old Yellow Enzyme family)/siroheme synthase (precorrin-2 oxidase/ferrochelatase) [Nocardioides nitrophenolicus]